MGTKLTQKEIDEALRKEAEKQEKSKNNEVVTK